MTVFNPVFVVILGLILGSFLSMLLPRLHYGEQGIVAGRSQCPHCKSVLRARDLIPLISFVLLKGRCHACKSRIAFWYPLIELTSALSFLALFLYVQNDSLFLWLAPHIFVLLFIFFYDLRYKEIHDYVMIPGIAYAFLATIWIGNPLSSLIGAGVGISFFGLQYLVSRGRWIGSGDIRIGAFMGLFLGWPMILLGIMLSYIIGSVISIGLLLSKNATGKTAVPLGPFLVMGTTLVFFCGDRILDYYLQWL